MYKTRSICSAVLLAIGICVPAAAQPAANGATSAAATNIATATRAPEAPTMDGDVLGDSAWASATPITSFTQE
jgi:hypothetical protein